MSTPKRPTSVRYVILALTVCVAVLLYLDRYCLGFVLPYIRANFRLSEDDSQFLVSAFFYTYAIGNIPCGWLSDRFGTRLMLAFYMAVWSALTGLMGLAQGFLTLVLFRFGCGLFEAGAYPACAGLIRRWIPYQQRGFASGVVSIGGRLGGTIAPLATAYLMVLFMPVSTPSLLEPRDLLHPRKLAHDLLSKDDPKLPAEVRKVLPGLQEKMSSHVRQVLKEFRDSPGTALPETALADALNEMLRRSDLADNFNLLPFLPKLNKQAVSLFELPAANLSEAEITRRNRCLFEVLFPDCIRKLEGDSWQPVLAVYGTIGVLLAIFFWFFYRDSPRQHFLTNQAEVHLVEAGASASEPPPPRFRAVAVGILASPGLWACAVVQFGTNFVWIFLGNQLPTYLERVHEVPIETRGWMTFAPFFVSLPMLLIGGWWTDQMTKKYGKRIGRAFPLASTRFLGAAAMFACCFLDSPWLIVFALCLFAMANDTGLPAIWAYNLDVGGRNVGLILGWGNMIGNLCAAVSASALGLVVNRFVNFDSDWTIPQAKAAYSAVFLVSAGVFVFIGFVSLLIDATKPIVVDEPSASP